MNRKLNRKSHRKFSFAPLAIAALSIAAAAPLVAQTPNLQPAPLAATAPTAVPALVPYSGAAIASDGKPLAGEAGITFLIYADQTGGEPLFAETQSVTLDAAGHYQVQLGASLSSGLPIDLFATGEARWLEVQIAGQPPQSRVLLASVPYALKSADAATLGGLPASAFVLAGSKQAAALATQAVGLATTTASDVTTTGGTTGNIPLFTGASTVANSTLFQDATGVGVGTTTPGATLDVNGKTIVRGALDLSRSGNATAAAGFDSVPLVLQADVFNSATAAGIMPFFQLQAEPIGNDTASPSLTLNLLSSTTGGTAAETGLYFNPNGTIHFAAGQTFPGGSGTGTITGVAAGTGLTGGGATGNVTLNVDTTKIPLLAAAANTFAGSLAVAGGESVTGNFAASGTASAGTVSAGTAFDLGGSLFAFGSAASNNAYLGFAGSPKSTGEGNTGVGYTALPYNTTGFLNVAVGDGAMYANTTGNSNVAIGASSTLGNNTTGVGNTAVGVQADLENATGSDNTSIGAYSGPNLPALSNTTAIGASAVVGQSNTLVLGHTTSGSPGANYVNVGIGTATPRSTLEAAVSASKGLGPVLTLTNTGGSGGAASAVDFNSYAPATSGTYNPAARIEALDDDYSDDLLFLSNVQGAPNAGLRTNMVIQADGQVGVNTSDTSDAQLMVSASAVDPNAIMGFGNNQGVGGFFSGGSGSYGIYATSSGGSAGYFAGNVYVNGTLSANAKNFMIDDPADPANKYLNHTSVESSEMMNIYSGNVTTDDLGLATVTLPGWFESENGDFRYQLTVIGGRFAQAIVSKEIQNGQFTISTNASNVKVSWQITAVRQDAYAKANPLVVEQEKPARERGFYQHPELYGQPAEKQTEWGRHPQMMQRMKQQSSLNSSAPASLRHDQPESAVDKRFPAHPPAQPNVLRRGAGLNTPLSASAAAAVK